MKTWEVRVYNRDLGFVGTQEEVIEMCNKIEGELAHLAHFLLKQMIGLFIRTCMKDGKL